MTATFVFTEAEQSVIDTLHLEGSTAKSRNLLKSAYPRYKSVIVKFDQYVKAVEAEQIAQAEAIKAQAKAEAEARAAEYVGKTHFDLNWNGEIVTVPAGLLEYIGLSKAILDNNNDYNNTAEFPLLHAFKRDVDEHLALRAVALGEDPEKFNQFGATRKRMEAELA